jgi:hypothetical protein
MKLSKIISPEANKLIVLIGLVILICAAILLSQNLTKKEGDVSSLIYPLYKSDPKDLVIEDMTVAPDTKLVMVTDLRASGAYNFYNDLYILKGTDLRPIEIVITSPQGIVEPKGEEPDTSLTNGYLSKTDSAYHTFGFLPFAAYPCNYDNKYEFYKDRLILVSSTQASGCKDITIEEPSDIPDNFERTPVEVYHITPEILKEAQKYY